MDFVSAWQRGEGTKYYRFKGTFSKPGPGKYEIRVTMNPAGKISAFATPPWSDNFDPGAK
jgi:hypothetical protein